MVSNSGPLDLAGLSSNVISDFGPILTLFGEQVAKQFMSQSMGWIDNIIFSMAPLGIITAIVGAIRVGGPGWLKAIVGRARENRAMAEIELMSSTSHEVCEMWDGQNIVRIMGAPEIRELISVNRTTEESNGPEEQVFGLYTLENKDHEGILCKIQSPTERWWVRKPKTTVEGSTKPIDGDPESARDDNRPKSPPKSAPNISLNLHSHAPGWELYTVALIGAVLQTAVLVYAYNSMYNSILRLKLGQSLPLVWAWYFTLIGTSSVVAGMLGCCYIIEKSTDEERYRVEGGEGHILWLQKGETVNDQVFYSHAIFAKNQRSILVTSRRNDKLTDPNHFFFGFVATAAALFSLVGFIVQFMGLRGMHWSVSVAQVLATVIMTILRAVVRRGLSKNPYSQQLPPEHEMDWLAVRFAEGGDRLKLREGPDHLSKDMTQSRWRDVFRQMFRRKIAPHSETSIGKFWGQGCYNWTIITGARCSGYEPSKHTDSGTSNSVYNRAQGVVEARKRLGYLTQWPGAYSDKATSVATAIEHVMNAPMTRLFDSNEVFRWSMAVDVGRGVSEAIEFKVENISGKWKADLAEIEAALSLWMFSVRENEKGTPMGDENIGKDAWLRSGKASTQQGIRLLGPSVPLSRRDMKWWAGDGLKKVLEVDLSKPGTYAPDSRVTIKSGDCRVVGIGGGQLLNGDYKIRPLSETLIEGYLDKKVVNESSLPDPVSVALGSEIPVDNDLGVEVDNAASLPDPISIAPLTKSKPKFYLATVSKAPLDLLFAQEMFSAFMWTFAKSPNVSRIGGQTTVQPQCEQGSNSNTDWKPFTLQNTTLSKLAQSIKKTGLGSLDEIYMSILPPLSAHGRLPDAGAVVDYIHQQTKKYQISGHWEKAGEMYLWIFRACSHGIPDVSHTAGHHTADSDPTDSDPTASIKATAALMEFLRSLSTEVERCKKQKFHQAERTSESLQKVLSNYAQILRGLGDRKVSHNLAWLYERQDRGVDWRSLVGVGELPDDAHIKNVTAFGLTQEHHTVLLNQERPKPSSYAELLKNVNKKDVLGRTPLHYAANRGDKSLIEELVAAGADWTSNDIREWTPLHYAAANETLELDWELLHERVDINMQGRDGFSPLHCAATSGNAKMATLLIESGANVQIYGNSRETPLHLAAYYGFTELVSLMLRYGANPRAADDYGRTPLHLAAMQGSGDVVEILMKVVGKMIDAKEGGRLTAIHMAVLNQAAISEGHYEVVQVLLKHVADVNAQGGQYGNALQAAALKGYGETVRVLLSHGADVNAQGGQYGNVLQAAALKGYGETVRVLLEKGADVNAQGGQYGNALQAAALRGHGETVRVLLSHGADVNAQGGQYGNALQAAALRGHGEIVEVLLEHGANVNVQGGRYGDALRAAASGGHVKIVQVLLGRRADVNARGGWHANALQVAALRGRGDIVQVLLEHGADANARGGEYGNALQAAALEGYGEIVQLFLEYGADVNAQGGRLGNALQAAAEGGYIEIVQVLLGRGANVNALGGWYANTLQAAASRGHGEIVNVLLEKGADVNKQGGEYGNALQAAALEGHGEIVQVLLGRGADFNAQGGKYGNALQAAALGGHSEIVQVLLGHGADVNAQGGKYGNALQAAVLGGYDDIMQLLLEYGADVNARGGEYGNALQAAALEGYGEIVQLFLEYGADVNAQGGRLGNAMQAAASEGHHEIVRMLRGHGVS